MLRFLLRTTLVIATSFAAAHDAHPPAMTLRLHGGQMTLFADKVPLSQILRRFREWEVDIDFMPDPDPLITVRMKATDIETALAELLLPYDYLLRWQVVPGPVERLPKLKAIRLVGFRGGQTASAQPYRASAAERHPEVMPHPLRPEALIIRDELLLRVKPGVTITELQRLLDQIDGGVIDGCRLVGVYRVRLRPHTNVPEMVARLRQHPRVDLVEPHWAWRLPEDPPQAGMMPGHGFTRTPTDRADTTATPAATTATAGRLAVLDTGIGRDVPWRDSLHAIFDLLVQDGSGDDTQGHGSHMTGLAGGHIQPMGIAEPGTWNRGAPEVLSMKIFDGNGIAPLFSMIRGVEQAIHNGANVLSLSWGGPQRSDFLEEALVHARQQGVITLAAAGNEPTTQTMYPAAFPTVLAVGALQPDGEPWPRSGHGPSINLAAPAFAVAVGANREESLIAGTSVATAYAAHIVARFHALHGDRSIEENLEQFLRALTPPSAGPDIPDPFPNAGRLDDAALQRLFDQPAP